MVLLDLDGTLLNSKSQLSQKTKEVLEELIDQDYKVFIATGRNFREAKKVTEDISGLGYITSNGGYIKDTSGEVIFNQSIANQDVIKLIDILEESSNISYSVFSAEDIFAKGRLKMFGISLLQRGRWRIIFSIKNLISIFNNIRLMPINKVKDMKKFFINNSVDIHKFFVLGVGDTLDKVKERIKEELNGRIKVTSSGSNNLEINAKDISKGRALEVLVDQFDINKEEVIAFGDSGNDLELFDMAGISVVMSNSYCEELREKADMIAESNDDDGVAKVLLNLLK